MKGSPPSLLESSSSVFGGLPFDVPPPGISELVGGEGVESVGKGVESAGRGVESAGTGVVGSTGARAAGSVSARVAESVLTGVAELVVAGILSVGGLLEDFRPRQIRLPTGAIAAADAALSSEPTVAVVEKVST